jgi:hypothetical protein
MFYLNVYPKRLLLYIYYPIREEDKDNFKIGLFQTVPATGRLQITIIRAETGIVEFNYCNPKKTSRLYLKDLL